MYLQLTRSGRIATLVLAAIFILTLVYLLSA